MPYPDPNQPADFSGFDYSGPGAAPGPGAAAPPMPGGPSAPPTPSGQAPTPQPPASPQPSPFLPQQQQNPDLPPGVSPAYTSPANRGGPVKNALTRMMYGMGQAMLQHVGLPTDYQIQQQDFKNRLSLAQQQVQQAHEQLLQQGQEYQQSQKTIYDPDSGQWLQMTPKEYGAFMLQKQKGQQAVNLANLRAGIPQLIQQRLAENARNGIDSSQDPDIQYWTQVQQGITKQTNEQRDQRNLLIGENQNPNDPAMQDYARQKLAWQKAMLGAKTTGGQRVVQTVDENGVVTYARVPVSGYSGPNVPAPQPPGTENQPTTKNTPAGRAAGGGGGGPVATPIMGPGGTPLEAPATAQVRSRAGAAQSVLSLVADAKRQLADPEVQAQMGPIEGRWSELGNRLGTMSPKARKLAGTLMSIYSLAGTMHGWRALQVAQEFANTYGDLKATPESLMGGLDAMANTAHAVIAPTQPSGGGAGAPTHIWNSKTQRAEPIGGTK